MRNSSNLKWNVPYVEGICQTLLTNIPERSCSLFGMGKDMKSFLGAGETILCV